jgi:hypothetical protein
VMGVPIVSRGGRELAAPSRRQRGWPSVPCTTSIDLVVQTRKGRCRHGSTASGHGASARRDGRPPSKRRSPRPTGAPSSTHAPIPKTETGVSLGLAVPTQDDGAVSHSSDVRRFEDYASAGSWTRSPGRVLAHRWKGDRRPVQRSALSSTFCPPGARQLERPDPAETTRGERRHPPATRAAGQRAPLVRPPLPAAPRPPPGAAAPASLLSPSSRGDMS